MKIEIGPFKFERTKKRKKKQEFSKKILVTAWLSGSAVILFACYLTYMMVIQGYEGNVELVAIILTGGFAEISLGTGFYYWKAKNENINKFGNNVQEDEGYEN